MAKPTLSEISKLFKTDDKPTDFHYYGTVVSADVENRTYEVSINRDENITVEAARLVGAHVGDTVMVTVMANGYATVTGRVGGDTDASDAQRKADSASDIADEAQRKAVNALGKATAAEQLANQAEQNAKRSADAAELAEENASKSADYASESKTASEQAQQAAETAQQNAADSQTAAETAQQNAADSQTAAEAARDRAATAEGYADTAQKQAAKAEKEASTANSYAVGALNNLSTTQDIMGVLSWVEESIKYVWDYPPTVEGKEYDPSKQYYTVIGNRVIDPIETDYDKYYVLNSESEPASKTGNIVIFDSDLDNFPLKSLTATINPKQSGSGDPAPDNVRPISGWDSVNVNVASGNLIDASTNQSGAIDTSGNEVANSTFNRTDFIPIDKAMIYVRTSIASGYNIRVHGYSSSKAWVQQLKVITTDGTTLLVGETVPSGVAYVRISYPLVAVDNTELWQADTYTTDLPETVYGGSLDVVNGVLTVDRAMVDYPNMDTTSGTAVTGGWRCNFTCPSDDANRGKWSIQTGAEPILSMSDGSAPLSSGGVSKGYGANEYTIIVANATSKAEADTALKGLQLVYKLSTPQTYQLTPQQINTLLGENNVWADSGDVTVEYWDGPVGYVTPTSSFDPTETYYTVKGSPVKIDESKQEEHGKGLYYVHDLTNAKEAMADFIKAHLALTDEGLYVLKGEHDWRVLVANDGVYIIDPQGRKVASYKDSITLGTGEGNSIRITSEAITFNIGDKTFAYVAQDKWFASNAEVSGAMYIGDYSLRQKSNGDFVLGRRR